MKGAEAGNKGEIETVEGAAGQPASFRNKQELRQEAESLETADTLFERKRRIGPDLFSIAVKIVKHMFHICIENVERKDRSYQVRFDLDEAMGILDLECQFNLNVMLDRVKVDRARGIVYYQKPTLAVGEERNQRVVTKTVTENSREYVVYYQVKPRSDEEFDEVAARSRLQNELLLNYRVKSKKLLPIERQTGSATVRDSTDQDRGFATESNQPEKQLNNYMQTEGDQAADDHKSPRPAKDSRKQLSHQRQSSKDALKKTYSDKNETQLTTEKSKASLRGSKKRLEPTEQSASKKPEEHQTDTVKADTSKADTVKADTVKADTVKADTVKAESSTNLVPIPS